MTRPLESGDQKDEICQFSDTSLEAIRHAITGIQNSFTGNAPGRVLAADQVPLFGLIAKADPSVATELENGFAQLLAKLNGLTAPFDQMIKPGQPGRATLEEVAAGLVSQGEVLGKVGVALGAKLSSMA